MMRFHALLTNGKENPIGIGRDITFHWNYETTDGIRGEYQRTFSVTIKDENGNPVYESGDVDGCDMMFRLPDCAVLTPGMMYFWTVTAKTENGTQLTSEAQTFQCAIDDLDTAAWIGCGEEAVSAPVFIRTFCADCAVVRAYLYVTGLGLIDCRMNGVRITDAMLQPPNTPYDRICYFETYDVTSFINEGRNLLEVTVGNGYNLDYSKWGFRYETPKGLRAALILVYDNGGAVRINTDEAWLWHDSPITANGLYYGEDYDARKRVFDCFPAVCMPDAAPRGLLTPNEMPPICIIDVLSPINCWRTDEGTVYDFGRNIQGVTELTVEAREGTEIFLQHSEMLYPDGRPDLYTNRDARAADTYICRGGETEIYRPTFTYHGFRYVCVRGAEQAERFVIKALHLSADVGDKAEFQCSHATLNHVHTMCAASMRSNFVSVPTDCPVRDERTPCQMDSQMYEDAAMYNFNMYTYYKKWLADITSDKDMICIGNPDWHGDALMLSYRLYRFYGDAEPARALYPYFKKALERWLQNSEEGLWTNGFGDWCLPNDNTWEGYHGCVTATNTSLLHAYTGIMEEYARLFGSKDDAAAFAEMGHTVRSGYIAAYTDDHGKPRIGRQPEAFLPLFYGIYGDAQDEKTDAENALLAKLRADGYLDTGGFSTRCVLPVLAEIERERPDVGALDTLMQVLSRNAYPGYGYMLARGATTLWEQWHYTGGMLTHSHAMHAGIDAALFSTICGIMPTKPGFAAFDVAPMLPRDMAFASCRIRTFSGEIVVNVERIGGGMAISLTVPQNTTAAVHFPHFDTYDDCILFDGEKQVEKTDILTVGGGTYCLRLVPKYYVENT